MNNPTFCRLEYLGPPGHKYKSWKLLKNKIGNCKETRWNHKKSIVKHKSTLLKTFKTEWRISETQSNCRDNPRLLFSPSCIAFSLLSCLCLSLAGIMGSLLVWNFLAIKPRWFTSLKIAKNGANNICISYFQYKYFCLCKSTCLEFALKLNFLR